MPSEAPDTTPPGFDRPATPEAPRIATLGLDGLLVTFGDQLDDLANRAALAFRGRIDAQDWPGIVETSCSLTSVYVAFDPAQIDHATMRTQLGALLDDTPTQDPPLPQGRTLWRIPAFFGGPHQDVLAEAARLAGLSADDAIAEICAKPLRALALGYAPGQAYLGTLPPNWDISRQKGLTPTVPEGAVVTAVRQVIVFATSGPTGWRQIGQTRFRGFRPENPDAPIALRPGDEVQLYPVDGDTLERLARQDTSGDAGATRKALP